LRARVTKLGFSTPNLAWVAADLREPIRDLLGSAGTRLDDIVDRWRVRKEFEHFWAGDRGALNDTALTRLLGLDVQCYMNSTNNSRSAVKPRSIMLAGAHVGRRGRGVDHAVPVNR